MLSPRRLSIDPGGEARAQVTVRNPGDLVEQYRFHVLGDAARWSQVVPRDVSVLPGEAAEMTVTLVFRPPAAPAAPAGEVPFGVRCVSMDQQDNCAVVEGDLTVSAVMDLSAALVPVGSKGRTTGRFRLQLANTGTMPIRAEIRVADAAELLRFAFAPAELTIEAGQTAAVFLQVRARTVMVFGKPVDHPFTVGYVVQGTERAGELPAVYRQRAIVRRWMVAVVLLAVLAGLAVAAILVLRPGADPGPALTTGGPPAVGTLRVVGESPDTVLLTWDPNPYATAYELHALRNGLDALEPQVVKAPVVQSEWTLSGSGPTCFQLVVLGTGGQPSKRLPQTDLPCVDLQGAAAASESVAAESAASAAAAAESAAASSSAAAASAAQSSADASSAAASSAAASAAAASSAAASSAAASEAAGSSSATLVGQFVPRRFWVIYYRTPVDGGLPDAASTVSTALQAAGARDVQVVPSTAFRTPPFAVPFYLVIGDDFADQAAAQAECAARTGVVANLDCSVQPQE